MEHEIYMEEGGIRLGWLPYSHTINCYHNMGDNVWENYDVFSFGDFAKDNTTFEEFLAAAKEYFEYWTVLEKEEVE